MLVFFQAHWPELTGTVLGFLYLYFELKADRRMWPVGILMSLFYVFVYFNSKFYAFAGINIYFIFAQVYGWRKWHKNPDGEDAPLLRMPAKLWWPLALCTIVLSGLIWLVLKLMGGSPVAWGDSLITGLNVVALWMLAQHYVEQWLPLVVANGLSVFLFYGQELYPTALLYAVFFVASVAGYIKWRKMASANKKN